MEWVPLPIGAEAIDTHGTPLPEETLDALEGLDAWILGPHDSASYPEPYRRQLTPGGRIRKHFDLYANIRRPRTRRVRAVSPAMDLVVVRENTEGFYADRNMAVGSGEFMPTPDVALAVGVVTRAACERIARTAFDLASKRRGRAPSHGKRDSQHPGRHGAGVRRRHIRRTTFLGHGLHSRRPAEPRHHRPQGKRAVDDHGTVPGVCREVARDYPSVQVDDAHVDAMAALLVRHGDRYDVIVTENMFGDILSDLTAELSGSLGTAASVNASGTRTMAQASHGAAPDIAGLGPARNPIALISSAAMLARSDRRYIRSFVRRSRAQDRRRRGCDGRLRNRHRRPRRHGVDRRVHRRPDRARARPLTPERSARDSAARAPEWILFLCERSSAHPRQGAHRRHTSHRKHRSFRTQGERNAPRSTHRSSVCIRVRGAVCRDGVCRQLGIDRARGRPCPRRARRQHRVPASRLGLRPRPPDRRQRALRPERVPGRRRHDRRLRRRTRAGARRRAGRADSLQRGRLRPDHPGSAGPHLRSRVRRRSPTRWNARKRSTS